MMNSGRDGRCDGIRLRALRRSSPLSPSRLGLRIHSLGPARAVTRNRARRRLRAAFAQVGPDVGWDVVIRANASLNGKSYQEIVSILQDALNSALQGEKR